MVSETSCDDILQEIDDELQKLKRETQYVSVRIEELRKNIRQTMFLKMKDEEEGNNPDEYEFTEEED